MMNHETTKLDNHIDINISDKVKMQKVGIFWPNSNASRLLGIRDKAIDNIPIKTGIQHLRTLPSALF